MKRLAISFMFPRLTRLTRLAAAAALTALAMNILGSTACSPSSAPSTCNPACAPGTHCVDTGCVVDTLALADMTLLPLPDMASTGCLPACSGGTHCNANRMCVVCLADADCAIGQVCQTKNNLASCIPGCHDDARCGGAGKACCDSACTDTTADTSNCGACGTTCNLANAKSTCAAGHCGLASCNPGFGDCNADPKDGCEKSLHSDVGNCNACGKVCALKNAISGCSDGCYLAACNFGFDNCNGIDTDGCEASVLSDVRNCGGCAKPCPPYAHAKAGCNDATCFLSTCDSGFFDCDGMVANGCETQIAVDAKNCGACGSACPMGLICQNSGCTCPQCNIPNAKSACVNMVCSLVSCLAGFGDCDMNVKNGCELPLLFDNNNCGACANVCPKNTPFCSNGVCGNFVLFQQPNYTAQLTFKDALQSTTMTMTWDGTSYWSSSGGSPNGVRYAQYDATGMSVGTYSPGIDFRSVFTKGANGMTIYAREYNQTQIRIQTAPGVFGNDVSLKGGALDAQAEVVCNDTGSEFIAMNNGTISRWDTNGTFVATLVLAGYGGQNGEGQQPQNRAIIKAGNYYLTYSSGVLSAWDTMGVRQKTTILNGAGTGSDAYYGISYANHMVWIVDVAGGTWRGYNVGL